MKVSASIEFVMQLAGQETIAGEYEKITPDHLMLGVLKFSELPVEEVDRIALGADAARGLAAEVDAVREELADRSVDSTKARRRLRSVLGKGGCPYEGGRMHRSQESKDVFDAGGILADDAGSEDFAAIHLLQAMLASPTEAMTKVLGDAVGEKVPKPSDTPKLAEHGRDLVVLAVEGELDPGKGRETERKALMRALADKKRGGVLLVTYDDAAAMAMVEGVAEAVAEGDRPNELKGTRIVDITAVKPKGKEAAQALEKLDKLLAEAASAKEVILFVPAIEAASKGKKTANAWMDRIKSVLTQETVRCICQVAPSVYRDQMAEDRSWKRLAHVLWIREEKKDDVPWEL